MGKKGGVGKNGGGKTDENSGHYVVCQQSTARTPTAGTPHARANKILARVLALHLDDDRSGVDWQYTIYLKDNGVNI